MARMRGVERDGALEPRLTKFDRRVLATVPESIHAELLSKPLSIWRLAEASRPSM